MADDFSSFKEPEAAGDTEDDAGLQIYDATLEVSWEQGLDRLQCCSFPSEWGLSY